MKTRGRRHNSGSKRRHTRKHYMRGGAVQQSENKVNGVIKVYDDTTPDTDGNWLVVPYLMTPTDGVNFADKTLLVWNAFRQYFIGQTGTDYLNKIIPTICNPNLPPSASSESVTPVSETPVSETPSSETPSSETPSSETPENLISFEPSSTSSEGSEGLTAEQMLSGGKRRIRRY
mgnify:CR=1 FL=1